VFAEFNVAKHVRAACGSVEGQEINLCADVGVRSKLGKKMERDTKSLESISGRAFAHSLLGQLDLPTEQQEQECSGEIRGVLAVCGRSNWPREVCAPGSASAEERRALARKTFVAALAEWANVRDLHSQFAMGPPGKDQACATVEDEHSAKEQAAPPKMHRAWT
jgi:hypothetical protein